MKIIKTSAYKRDLKRKIENKHLEEEIENISKIENLLMLSTSMKEVLENPLSIIYGIEKKKGNLKEIYTAKVNSKLRLRMKPVGEYPYNLEYILEIELLEIDDKHYGEG